MGYPLLTNGAGEECKTIEQIRRILSLNPSRGAVLGSATLEERKGNPEPNFYYFEDSQTSINSIGLKNPGLPYYKEIMPRLFREFKDCLLIPSIASAPVENGYDGISAKELSDDPSLQFEILARELGKIEPKRTYCEINGSCPNLIDKYPLYEDVEVIGKIMERVENVVGKRKYTVKLGYMLPKHLNSIVDMISGYDPYAVVAINTMRGLIKDGKGRHCLYPESGGIGGIGGRQIKPFALCIISGLRKELDRKGRSDIKIVGSGGIFNALDGIDFITEGADHLQMWTGYMANKDNVDYFTNFTNQLLAKLEDQPEVFARLKF